MVYNKFIPLMLTAYVRCKVFLHQIFCDESLTYDRMITKKTNYSFTHIHHHRQYFIGQKYSTYSTLMPRCFFLIDFFIWVFGFSCTELKWYRVWRSNYLLVFIFINNTQSKCICFQTDNLYTYKIASCFGEYFVEI